MADYLTTDTELTSIASAIRSKGGTSAALVYPSGFISAIQEIQTVGTYQSKVVSPTESQQVVNPDFGYDALSSVTINAISSTYIGTGIAQNSASDLVVDGAVVTVPSGYYATAASASTNAGATYTCTIIKSNSTSNNNSVKYNDTYYKTAGDTFTYHAGDIAILNLESNDYVDINIDYHSYGAQYNIAYEYTLPNHNIEITILPDFWYSTMVVEFPTITITENGIHAVDSYYYADVNVYPSLQSKSNIIPIESSQTITADSSYYGLSSVQIAAISSKYVGSGVVTKAAESYGLSGSTRTIPSGTYLIGNQTILPFKYSGISGQTIKYGTVVKIGDSEDDDRMISITGGFTGANYVSTGQTAANSSQILEGYSAWVNGDEVKGNIPTESAATINPTENEQIAVAAGKYTMGAIKVAAINSSYVGSNIPQRTSTDLSASGSIVTIPSGYYAAAASKAVIGGAAKTPATTITANPTISINSSGLITAAVSSSKSVTPTVTSGYVSSGTSGTITVSGSKTSQLTTKAATTINPTESEQIAVPSGNFTTGIVKVGAIPSTYVGSGIVARTSANLLANGSIVTAPSGYYAATAAKAVSAGSVIINSPTITANPTVTLNSSTGVVTATVNNNTSIGATLVSGYISTYTGGTAQASGSKTLQLTTKSAATYTPSSTTQTIASGQYLTGIQTITGDSNLVAANIASGVTIFGITGTYTGETYVAMTTQEIWEAAASGWGSTNPSVAAAIWNSVAAGWSISATMTDSTIHTSVASGWR